MVLENNDGTNLGELAQLLDVNASTDVRMMDRLASAGLVTREDNPASGREVVLGLTPSGRRVVRRVTAARRLQIARIVQAMPTARRGQVVLALRAFAAAGPGFTRGRGHTTSTWARPAALNRRPAAAGGTGR